MGLHGSKELCIRSGPDLDGQFGGRGALIKKFLTSNISKMVRYDDGVNKCHMGDRAWDID